MGGKPPWNFRASLRMKDGNFIRVYVVENVTVGGGSTRVMQNFTRSFHKSFGKTASQFVAEARIAEARQRILVPL